MFIKPELDRVNMSRRLYTGIVEDVEDPKKMGRIRIRAVELWGSEIPVSALPWAVPSKQSFEGSLPGVASFHVPVKGATVNFYLDMDDIYSPVYTTAIASADQVPDEFKENYPERYGFLDSCGNAVIVDRQDKTVAFTHSSGTRIDIDKDGSVSIHVVKNSEEEVASDKSVIVRGTSSFVVEGDSSIEVKGDSNITVRGDVNADLKGDANLTVSGDVSSTISGNLEVQASKIDAKVTGDINLDVSGNIEADISGNAIIRTLGSTSIKSQSDLNVECTNAVISASGNVDVSGNGKMNLDCPEVKVTSVKVELGGSPQSVVLGDAFSVWVAQELSTWLSTHVHVSAKPGDPTSPPPVPFLPGSATIRGPIYSKFVKAG